MGDGTWRISIFIGINELPGWFWEDISVCFVLRKSNMIGIGFNAPRNVKEEKKRRSEEEKEKKERKSRRKHKIVKRGRKKNRRK